MADSMQPTPALDSSTLPSPTSVLNTGLTSPPIPLVSSTVISSDHDPQVSTALSESSSASDLSDSDSDSDYEANPATPLSSDFPVVSAEEENFPVTNAENEENNENIAQLTVNEVSSPSSSPSADMALLVAKEFVDSESRFLQTLDIFITVFISPCLSAASSTASSLGKIAIDPRVQVFFSSVLQIFTLNKQFLSELSQCVDEWNSSIHSQSTTKMGQIFLHYAPLFKIFSQYARDHEAVSNLLLTAVEKKGSKFSTFITSCESNQLCKGQTLASFLIAPVQRVPRYRLLLEELRRRTPPDHPGQKDLFSAIEQSNQAALHVNQTIKDREMREKLMELERKFVSKIDLRETLQPRWLIREGLLQRLTRRGATTYYFHLFNDLLLYSEDTVKGYKLHRRVALADRFSVSELPSKPRELQISSPQKSFVICTKSESDKKQWLEDFHYALQLLKKNSSMGKDQFVAPVWTQDKENSKCSRCSAEFSVLRRRHRKSTEKRFYTN
jgi:hypothetical protein